MFARWLTSIPAETSDQTDIDFHYKLLLDLASQLDLIVLLNYRLFSHFLMFQCQSTVSHIMIYPEDIMKEN